MKGLFFSVFRMLQPPPSLRIITSVACLAFALPLLTSCSDSGNNEGSGPDRRSPAERAADQIASRYQIPVRFILASGYLESRLRPEVSGSTKEAEGPESRQTAFGLSSKTLELTEASAESLSSQIEAYGRWLSQHIPAGLKQNPQSDEEKYQWIWSIAEAHRKDDSTRTLFSIEMIDLLNKGFVWVDPDTNKVIPFPQESPAINTGNLSAVANNHLQLSSLTTSSPDKVYNARFLRLHNQGSHDHPQSPVRIRVTHCPMSFSACIEEQLWDGKSEKKLWLGAHYFIPPSESVTDMPLQIVPHNEAVAFTNPQGELEFSDNEVIIALTGISGVFQNGVRRPADPLWLNEYQLQNLGSLTDYVCDRLAYHNPDITRDDCLTVNRGTIFDIAEDKNDWSWGNIPDFDPVIFRSYIGKNQTLSGKTIIEFPDNKKIYRSGESVEINLTFGLRAKSVELERLIRCPGSDKVHWSVIDREQVEAQNNFLFKKQIFGSGPNGNGAHFFRAKVFDKNNALLGWDQSIIYLTEYEKEPGPIFPSDCQI